MKKYVKIAAGIFAIVGGFNLLLTGFGINALGAVATPLGTGIIGSIGGLLVGALGLSTVGVKVPYISG